MLKLYLERLGTDFATPGALRATAGPALGLITEGVCDPRLLGARPSLLAAAALLAARQAQGEWREACVLCLLGWAVWVFVYLYLLGYGGVWVPAICVAAEPCM